MLQIWPRMAGEERRREEEEGREEGEKEIRKLLSAFVLLKSICLDQD